MLQGQSLVVRAIFIKQVCPGRKGPMYDCKGDIYYKFFTQPGRLAEKKKKEIEREGDIKMTAVAVLICANIWTDS